ncbi:MAG: ribosome biogenesis GTP-binding protein YihA/YsxC [Dysgonamonadaceae bacterium]|jgi:GTP-binding protein|nr:ribosome biogenesis GTP-binding protein YihA/YsxC [Dysgonamonadaceae bacterium]
MVIHDAQFVISSVDYRQCPQDGKPEYAFIGRSNVGKSSLINMLTNRKSLAKTSSTPGKTLLINHFLINNEWYLVDLPGYGYARKGKKERDRLKKIIEGYVLGRSQMTLLFVLIDSRHEPQKIDLALIDRLGENGIPFALVFTKSDKLSAGKLQTQIENYKQTLYESWEELPPIFVTSSTKGTGREELLDYIEQINRSLG